MAQRTAYELLEAVRNATLTGEDLWLNRQNQRILLETYKEAGVSTQPTKQALEESFLEFANSTEKLYALVKARKKNNLLAHILSDPRIYEEVEKLILKKTLEEETKPADLCLFLLLNGQSQSANQAIETRFAFKESEKENKALSNRTRSHRSFANRLAEQLFKIPSVSKDKNFGITEQTLIRVCAAAHYDPLKTTGQQIFNGLKKLFNWVRRKLGMKEYVVVTPTLYKKIRKAKQKQKTRSTDPSTTGNTRSPVTPASTPPFSTHLEDHLTPPNNNTTGNSTRCSTPAPGATGALPRVLNTNGRAVSPICAVSPDASMLEVTGDNDNDDASALGAASDLTLPSAPSLRNRDVVAEDLVLNNDGDPVNVSGAAEDLDLSNLDLSDSVPNIADLLEAERRQRIEKFQQAPGRKLVRRVSLTSLPLGGQIQRAMQRRKSLTDMPTLFQQQKQDRNPVPSTASASRNLSIFAQHAVGAASDLAVASDLSLGAAEDLPDDEVNKHLN